MWLLSLKNDVNTVYLQKLITNKQIIAVLNVIDEKSKVQIRRSGDPYKNVTDPHHWFWYQPFVSFFLKGFWFLHSLFVTRTGTIPHRMYYFIYFTIIQKFETKVYSLFRGHYSFRLSHRKGIFWLNWSCWNSAFNTRGTGIHSWLAFKRFLNFFLCRYDGSGAGDVDTSTVVEPKDGKERDSHQKQ